MQTLGTICRWLWRLAAAASILFTGCCLLLIAALISGAVSLKQHIKADVQVPKGCALILAPAGSILEEQPLFDPAEELLGLLNKREEERRPVQLLLQDIISGLRAAAKDERIKLLVIAPDMLEQAGLDQLRDIGQAIEQFKSSGKVVIATADTYSQGQYYLASWSDEIYLNPMGSVDLHGFGVFNLYLRELLDRLKITFHIFRVGAFKSAVEPLLRNDMSPEAKEDSRRWLTNLWNGWCADIARQRGLLPEAVHAAANNLTANLRAADGDPALMAKNSRLVDGLKTKEEFRQYLQTLVGSNDDGTSFKRIDFSDYLKTVKTAYSTPLDGKKDRIVILVAQGSIVYGPGGEDQIGSDEMIGRLRRLRQDKQVKALVLRIDSGGGSAFASELIRQELLLLQKAGKKVVVSMGSMAASGAYWIAADADRIFASPRTLTGSIGIFGALPTFEKTLAKAGVFTDGIGTTELAGAGSLMRPLPEAFSQAMQAQIERGYRQFIDIVSQGRNMDRAEVENIAGGRVWDGANAVEIGLVDKLGNLEDAVAAAAQLVNLPPDQAEYFQEPDDSPVQMLLRRLHPARAALTGSGSSALLTLADRLFGRAARQYDFLSQVDPQHIYSHCLLPFSVLAF